MEELLVKTLIGVGVIVAVYLGWKLLNGKKLWARLNEVVRNFCDRIQYWLRGHHSFGAKIIRITIEEIEEARKFLNRTIQFNAEAIDENRNKVQITTQDVTEEQLKEWGIPKSGYKELDINDLTN